MYKNYNKEDTYLNSLKIYLKEINKIPLLTHEQEQELCERKNKGDSAAKEKLINSNLRFVIKVAKKYQGQGLLLEDLIAEGNSGLIRAVEMFDYTKAKLSTYSHWWIESKIRRALLRTPTVSISDRKMRLLGTISLLQNKGHSLEEIAKIMRKDSDEIEDILNLPTSTISLDSPISDSDGSLTYGEVIPETKYSEINSELSEKEIFSVLKKYFRKRDLEILRLRFGFEGHYTLREIGPMFNLTAERVRQIENRAIKKLKAYMDIPEMKSELEVSK